MQKLRRYGQYLTFFGWSLLFVAGAYGIQANIEASVRATLIHEGGSRYTNHPSDPGGPTKYGITIHDVRRYINPRATALDVRNLTEAQAIAIYNEHYAKPVWFDQLPYGLDYSVFDFSVNAGTGRGIGTLRSILGLSYKGRMTKEVITLILKQPIEPLIHRYNAARMRFQMGLGSRYNVFKKGWRNRINSVDAGAIRMYRAHTPTSSHHAGPGEIVIPRIGPGKAWDQDELEENESVQSNQP